jgi:glycosyltransferase involved in cell wall biosynthesis
MTSLQISDLPPPPKGKTGWPWTEMSHGSGNPDNENCTCPRISIVTPSYNQGQYIEETIRSVLLQDYPNLEYIVIDGGSSDATLQILKRYDHLIHWISEPDEGQTDAINKGLKMASGEIVAYLNSDDLYEPGALASIAAFFCQQEDIAMIYGDIIHIDEKSGFIEFHKTGEVTLQKYLMAGDFYLPQPSVFFRKRVIETLGYFDKKLHLAMDYDYWLKIIMKYKTRYVPVALSRARIYPEAKSSSQNYKYLDELLAIYQSLFAQYPKLEPLRNDVFGYAYFVGALTFMRRHYFAKAMKNFRIAVRFDPRYFIHPYLYWCFIEICIGEKNARKIRPRVKKILDPIIYTESYNNIR